MYPKCSAESMRQVDEPAFRSPAEKKRVKKCICIYNIFLFSRASSTYRFTLCVKELWARITFPRALIKTSLYLKSRYVNDRSVEAHIVYPLTPILTPVPV